MKKALKILGIVTGVLLIAFFVFIYSTLKMLPSPYAIKSAITPKQAAKPSFTTPAAPPPSTEDEQAVASQETPKTHAEIQHQRKVDELKELSARALKEDFMNENKALASVCPYLAAAPTSRFIGKNENASAKEFLTKLLAEDKDPVVESAAPLFRYLFSIPEMRELVDIIEKARAENDNGIFQKAVFYSKVIALGQTLKEDKHNIDSVLNKTYNMFILSRVVAEKPELARDPATLSFCEQMEKNLNFNLAYNAEEQSAEMMKFLNHAGVDPANVGYDPNYRSDVNYVLNQGDMKLTNIWLERIFGKDIERAESEVKKELPPTRESK